MPMLCLDTGWSKIIPTTFIWIEKQLINNTMLYLLLKLFCTIWQINFGNYNNIK